MIAGGVDGEHLAPAGPHGVPGPEGGSGRSRTVPRGLPCSAEARARATNLAVPRVASRTTVSGVPEVRLTRYSYSRTPSPPTVPVANSSAAAASSASRPSAGTGPALRNAASARSTYTGGTRLSRATSAPDTSVTVSGTRVR